MGSVRAPEGGGRGHRARGSISSKDYGRNGCAICPRPRWVADGSARSVGVASPTGRTMARLPSSGGLGGAGWSWRALHRGCPSETLSRIEGIGLHGVRGDRGETPVVSPAVEGQGGWVGPEGMASGDGEGGPGCSARGGETPGRSTRSGRPPGSGGPAGRMVRGPGSGGPSRASVAAPGIGGPARAASGMGSGVGELAEPSRRRGRRSCRPSVGRGEGGGPWSDGARPEGGLPGGSSGPGRGPRLAWRVPVGRPGLVGGLLADFSRGRRRGIASTSGRLPRASWWARSGPGARLPGHPLDPGRFAGGRPRAGRSAGRPRLGGGPVGHQRGSPEGPPGRLIRSGIGPFREVCRPGIDAASGVRRVARPAIRRQFGDPAGVETTGAWNRPCETC